MSQKRSPIQERLDRYRSGEVSESTQKKRKTSRILLFVNLLLIMGIFLIMRKPEENRYLTSTVEFDGVHYRVSITRDKKTGYLASITLQPATKEALTRRYHRAVAIVSLKYRDTVLTRTLLGPDIPTMSLLPGETKNFTSPINDLPLREYAKTHPEALVPPRKAFIFSETQFIPLDAVITLQTGKPVSISLNFKYEVP